MFLTNGMHASIEYMCYPLCFILLHNLNNGEDYFCRVGVVKVAGAWGDGQWTCVQLKKGGLFLNCNRFWIGHSERTVNLLQNE